MNEKFIVDYVKLLLKDRFFLLANISFASLVATGYYANFHLLNFSVFSISIIVNITLLTIYLIKGKKATDKFEEKLKEDMKILDFWNKEVIRLYNEAIAARNEGFAGEQKLEELEKQYRNAASRFISELQRIAENSKGVRIIKEYRGPMMNDGE